MDNRHHASRRPTDNDDRSPITLQELDPSPVEWTPDLKQGGYFPNPSSSNSNDNNHSPQKLGLSGRGWEYWRKTTSQPPSKPSTNNSPVSSIQKYSTYPPTLFLALHLTNTSLIPLATQSVPASETFLLLTRPIYQSPTLEPLLLTLPILTHITSGLALRILRHRRRARLYGAETRAQRHDVNKSWKFPSLQARLGYLLLPLLGAHVAVNRVVPVYVDGGSSGVGLGYVAHGMARAPWVMRMSYVGLVGLGVWHFVGGWAWWMGWRKAAEAPKKLGKAAGVNGGFLGSVKAGNEFLGRSRRVWWVVNGLAVVGTGLWLVGGLGVIGMGGLGSGWEAREWDKIYAEVPVLGKFLMA
ncbi:hypothetical protein FQN50_002965 [Emmonsiellopsis sp. PD_5]|nr:hypothetical protein FQN50_002965 [Emmonsiellopsis sp. PD_5]